MSSVIKAGQPGWHIVTEHAFPTFPTFEQGVTAVNTNRANAYSPEAIALREQEGMTICDNCLTEHYSYEQHSCPPGIEYLAQYAAAPDWREGTWTEYTITDLDELASELDATTDPGTWTEWGRDALKADQRTLIEARHLAMRGAHVYVAQDEDGYYFAIAQQGDGSTVTLRQATEEPQS